MTTDGTINAKTPDYAPLGVWDAMTEDQQREHIRQASLPMDMAECTIENGELIAKVVTSWQRGTLEHCEPTGSKCWKCNGIPTEAAALLVPVVTPPGESDRSKAVYLCGECADTMREPQ